MARRANRLRLCASACWRRASGSSQRYGRAAARARTPNCAGRRWPHGCRPDADGRALLRQAVATFGLSARGYDRVLKVARTIADLGGDAGVRAGHVAEALQYRIVERGAEAGMGRDV